MKYLTIAGCRPNIIKLIPELSDCIVYTGQHYDKELGEDFFKELNLPNPKYNLHTTKLGSMINDIIDILGTEKPDGVIVYGDTRSSYAGAIAANERRIPIIHIEAGCRNYDRTRPEENYRLVIDHLSSILFCVNDRCQYNLAQEGITENVYVVGDVLYDRYVRSREHKGYLLATIHREENLNYKDLTQIVKFFASFKQVVFPLHPRTKKLLDKCKIELPENVLEYPPVPYGKMRELIRQAEYIITDSGGIQREASFMGTPCLVLGRSEWSQDLNRFGYGDASQRIIKILKGGKNEVQLNSPVL